MSERLLKTLDSIQARDEVTSNSSILGLGDRPDNVDENGEWLGEPPEGYQPLEAPELKVENKETAVQEFEHSDAKVDYMRVRDTTYAIQEATLVMLQQSARLAANTESPRAFTVFCELGNLMRGLNKDLMDNLKNYKAATQGDEPKTGDDTEINIETDGNGGTRVTVGKTNRRSSRDLMEVARQLQAENEEKRRRELEQEAVEGEFVEGEDNGSAT